MRDTIFLYIIAILAFGFGLVNFIQFLMKRGQTAQTVGTIISIKNTNPQNTKYRNSKWATVSYKVNGKTYQSQNRIQVPIAAQVGTTTPVLYDINHPEKLYRFSVTRIVVSFLIAAVCAALAMSNLI
mgnify:CR=1 FL=1